MRLENEFVVPRPVDEAWAVLTDVERIAPCMPGAQLTEVVDDDYHGTVKVKVGPVVAQYAGVARFRERDDATHHAVLAAKGKERNGRGMASALVTADLTGEGDSTRVSVRTDLTISGPLAQFGRGAIAEISAKLLGEFVDRLKTTVLNERDRAAAASAAAAANPAPSAAAAADAEAGGAEAGGAPAGGARAASAPTDSADPAGSATPPAPGDADGGPAIAASTAGSAAGSTATAAPPIVPAQHNAAPAAAPSGRRQIDSPEAAPADLMKVAGMPLLKRLLPVAVALVVVIVVLVLWLG